MSKTEVQLVVGDRLMDNDPRLVNRVLTVIDVLPNGVSAVDSRGRVFLYLRKRIHTDNRARKSGLKLLREVPHGQ